MAHIGFSLLTVQQGLVLLKTETSLTILVVIFRAKITLTEEARCKNLHSNKFHRHDLKSSIIHIFHHKASVVCFYKLMRVKKKERKKTQWALQWKVKNYTSYKRFAAADLCFSLGSA